MRRDATILACFLTIPILLFGQGTIPRKVSSLLPNSVHVSGTVVDRAGNAIAAASIWHTNDQINAVFTEDSGHFDFSTRAPAFVIRKRGYESVFVRTEDAKSIKIELQESNRVLPTCSNKSSCTSIDSFAGVFCFPRVKGVKVSEQANDIDYENRTYSVQSINGRQGMRHGGGPMWGAGMPFDEDVWSSVEYSEKTYAYGPGFIVDARGKTKSGKFWRSIGRFGESADYRDVNQEAAAKFDQLIDGVCIRENKQK